MANIIIVEDDANLEDISAVCPSAGSGRSSDINIDCNLQGGSVKNG